MNGRESQGWELEEIRSFFFPQVREMRRCLAEASMVDRLRVLALRDRDGSLFGAALYDCADRCLNVARLTFREPSVELAQLLFGRLREVAVREGAEAILVESRLGSSLDLLLKAGGFRLRAFRPEQSEEPGSPVLGCWALSLAASAQQSA